MLILKPKNPLFDNFPYDIPASTEPHDIPPSIG